MHSDIALWTPDIFTHTQNIFVNTNEATVLTVARDHYGLPGKLVQQSCGFEANSQNFHVDGVLMKRLRGNKSVIAYQLALYHYLHAHGITTPEIILNNDGDCLTLHNDALWVAMEYIDGRFYAGTYEEIEVFLDIMPRLFHIILEYTTLPP